MPFEEGNNAAKNKGIYQSALKRALARSKGNVDGGLNAVADKLVEAALEGEQWAIKEIADRIDGKPAQTHGFDQESPLQMVMNGRVKLVRPD